MSTAETSWREVADPISGRLYWYNDRTKESSWDAPGIDSEYGQLPSVWTAVYDAAAAAHFFTNGNGSSQWIVERGATVQFGSTQWTVSADDSQRQYYVEKGSGASVWSLPIVAAEGRPAPQAPALACKSFVVDA